MKNHKRGNIYRNGSTLYILASFGMRELTLISLKSGMKWGVPKKVSHSLNITEAEFEAISRGGNFHLVNNVEATFEVPRPEVETVSIGRVHK